MFNATRIGLLTAANLLAILLSGGIVAITMTGLFSKPAGPIQAPQNQPTPPTSVPTATSLQANNQSETQVALTQCVELLEAGHEKLLKYPAYSAVFYKEERIDGELEDGQTMIMKCRHDPFSIYLKWTEKYAGKEVLFVEGEHDGRMLVRESGNLGRFLPTFRLSPTNPLAMKESRYPITEAGLCHLTEMLLKYRKRDLHRDGGVQCVCSRANYDSHDCYRFELTYASPDVEPVYYHTILFIDKKLSLTRCVKNFGWPEDAAEPADPKDAPLLEMYSYSDIEFHTQLANNTFDHRNQAYTFKR